MKWVPTTILTKPKRLDRDSLVQTHPIQYSLLDEKGTKVFPFRYWMPAAGKLITCGLSVTRGSQTQLGKTCLCLCVLCEQVKVSESLQNPLEL